MRADCDALPGGQRLRLVSGSHFETGGGPVPLPVQGETTADVIYPRFAPDGVRFAGIGNRDDLCWEWNGVTWNSYGLAFGPRAVIYDALGNLQIIRPPGPAVGYRYVAEDGRLITANETLADPARRIWEYTTLGGITIGQGGEGPHGDDPCIAIVGSAYRLISEGRCRLINVTWDKDQELYAIAFVREDIGSSQFHWLTRQQILDCPVYDPFEVVVPAINRPVWLAFFAGAPDAPHPWTASTPPWTLPGNGYLSTTDGILRTMDGQAFAQYVAAEAEGQSIAEEVAKARERHPELPVIPYWVRQDHGGPIPPGDWVGVEAYCGVSEPFADFEDRLRAVVARCPRVALIAQCFTSNSGLTANLSSLVPIYARIARDCGNVIAVPPFSGSGRSTGLQDHPEVDGLWRQLAAGIPSSPPIELIPIPDPEDPDPIDPEEPNVPQPIYSDQKFQEYIDAAATILQQVRPGRPFVELQQSCREMGDRYRGSATPENPTVSELFWAEFLRGGTAPIDATKLDDLVEQLIVEQERLRWE